MVLALVTCTGTPTASSPKPTPNVTARQSTAPTQTATASVDDKTVTVQMAEHFYSPALVKVKVGTTVVWWNVGTQVHDVNAVDNSFHSNNMDPGDRFTYAFFKPGVYKYFCIPHAGDGMTGEVDVE